MRALLIGIGGAGSRIVNTLTAHDEKSPVNSVCSYVFDADRKHLDSLKSIAANRRIVLAPNMLGTPDSSKGTDFDISNITAYIDSIIDVDAVIICAGLGGRMAEAIPGILRKLNKEFTDPVFTLLTLPARSEGARVSARAAAELAEIRKEENPTVLFDNESWLQRLEEKYASKKNRNAASIDGLSAHQNPKFSVANSANELNELLARRVELLLRAGEISENGLETAEIVLDAGEVLNTLNKTDIVSIGYAAERLPAKLLGFFNRFRMEKYLLEEGEKRTARIAELAKRAVYEEVSIPCDLTTADKALVLITGPSNELSMKGFQTIRKWIDRSIKGLEMRAGDYPVRSTKDVAVIIVLAGIENVPRIAELEEIRRSYEEEVKKSYHGADELFNEINADAVRAAEDAELFEEGNVVTQMTEDGAVTVPAIPADSDAGSVAQTITQDGIDIQVSSAENTQQAFPEIDADAVVNSAEDEDVFEDTPVSFKSEGVQTQNQRTNVYPSAAQMQRGKQKRKADPQIFLAGGKRKQDTSSSAIPLPKRNKQPDMVLSGQADLGMRKITKDADDRVSASSAKRPKETDGAIQIGQNIKPKDSTGVVRVGSGQRPNDRGSAVKVGSAQRPNDSTGAVRIGSGQRPNDSTGAVRIGSGQRPNDTTGAVRIGSGQRAHDDMGAIRIGSGQRPNDATGTVRIGSGQRAHDDMGAIRIGSGQRPNDATGTVRIGSGQRAHDDMGDMKIAAAHKANDSFSSVKFSEKGHAKEVDTTPHMSAAHQPKEVEPKRVGTAVPAPKETWRNTLSPRKNTDEQKPEQDET